MAMQDSDETTAVAQTMGFSSFGGPDRPRKKRRHDGTAPSDALNAQAPSALGDAAAANQDEMAHDNGDKATAPLSSRPPSLPQRPPTTSFAQTSLAPRNGPNCYEAYYDCASIQNPWALLESALSLHPNSPWPAP
ncbi:hypothetical protein CDD82_5 [Ophiocordyceps australis]|uniref:Uncharacterized protein n=1 Tax=Ophiocordyceps australis TaxID=1399860 RepID=A0A2C5ZUX8_9HYPO|nr:hypothetical protein CDD82_5 [Ophiocordyceps australis]